MILTKENFNVLLASNGRDGLIKFKSFDPDLVILDIMLPDINGHEVLKELNKIKKTSVIMLTAKNDIIDKVLGLELGADDYITKPFDNRELIARVKAVLRRFESSSTQNITKLQPFVYLDLEINFVNQTVLKAGKQVSLTPKEYKLLVVMVNNPGRVFSREDLLLKAWGYDFLGDSRAVDICITRLRKKLEDNPAKPVFLSTVYGFGYKFGG
jgi:DNA-binding response OmpR family regulator